MTAVSLWTPEMPSEKSAFRCPWSCSCDHQGAQMHAILCHVYTHREADSLMHVVATSLSLECTV